MGRKILAVDDDPDQLKMVCSCLKEAGFAISTATNGFDALKKARALSPDLIVLDVMIPQLDGFAVCATLREDDATAATPILLLTGLSSNISRLTGVEAGATDYLVKPFNPEELVSKVEALLCSPSAAQESEKTALR